MFKIGDKVVYTQGAEYPRPSLEGVLTVHYIDSGGFLYFNDSLTDGWLPQRFVMHLEDGEKVYTQAQVEELIEKVAKQFDWLSFGNTTVGRAFKKLALELMKEM